jgi:putative CRISPR-associated protein (TIGR02619 family)
MAVGALIASKLQSEEKQQWIRIKKEDLMALREGQAKGQSQLEASILERLYKLDLFSEQDLQNASPEIKSLAKIGVSVNDHVKLYSSETHDGILTARVVCQFARVIWKCRATVEVVSGLQVEDPGRFRSQGVVRYVQSLVREVTDPQAKYGSEVLLNATAGFKSLVPYTTLVGLLFGVPVQYIFETSTELISLPPLPVDFDQEFIKRVESLLKKIEDESAISHNELSSLLPEERDELLPLLEQDGNQYTLSALGLIVYERFKSPPELKLSLRKPDDKDHTRDFSQETHRSNEFEEFKKRLSGCAYVDGFNYLKGADITRKDAKWVGDELHVACGGIELCVQTTATHPSHRPIVLETVKGLLK